MLFTKWNIIVLLANFLSLCFSQVSDESLEYHPLKLLHVHRDLMIYVKVVEYVADYVTANFNDINPNLAFGLFVARIHLDRALYDLSYKMSISLKERIDKLLTQLINVVKRYRFKVDTMTSSDELMFKEFTDSRSWMIRLLKFRNYTHHPYLLSELEDIYTPWDNYQKNVAKFNYWIPSPRQSESCLRSLAKNSVNYGTIAEAFMLGRPQCKISPVCHVFLASGTTFGYALYHRLLLLIFGKYGRGCKIPDYASEELAHMQQFCSMGYAEICYIVYNEYGNPDLMLEIMLLCTLSGQSEFLYRPWLQTLMKLQIKKGCFGSKTKIITVGDENRTRVALGCNSHITGVAVGTYAAAVRYHLQKYIWRNLP